MATDPREPCPTCGRLTFAPPVDGRTSMYEDRLDELKAERDQAVRERDSLARRCAERYEETVKLREQIEYATRERDEARRALDPANAPEDDDLWRVAADEWLRQRDDLIRERDEARAHRDKVWAREDRVRQRIQTWNDDPETRLQMLSISAEQMDELTAERDAVRAEADAMRPVVEAAKAWTLATFGGNPKPIDGDEDYYGPTELALAAAVDTYTTTHPEASDG